MTLAVVVATNRPDSLAVFQDEWRYLFAVHDIELIVVRDEPATWEQIPDFIPRRTGAIRSWGFLQAWHWGHDVIALDDDCLPPPDRDPIQEYLDAFDHPVAVSDYFDVGHTFGLGEYMRGFPFSQRRVATPVLQYGGWHGVPDMDAVTQAEHEQDGPIEGYEFDARTLAVPVGCAFTACIMNAAIKHEALPMMYQLLMGVDRVGYDRYDDLWSGLIAKKICDHLGLPIVINGRASIIHTRASDTAANLRKEQGGYELHEVMWERLKNVRLFSDTIAGCYFDLACGINPLCFGPHGDDIVKAMLGWVDAL